MTRNCSSEKRLLSLAGMGLVIGVVLLLVTPAEAQHRGRHRGFSGRHHGHHRHHGFSRSHGHHRHHGFRHHHSPKGLGRSYSGYHSHRHFGLGHHHHPRRYYYYPRVRSRSYCPPSRYYSGAAVIYPLNTTIYSPRYETAPAAPQSTSDAEDPISAGLRLFRDGDFARAADVWRGVVLQQPAEASARFYLGQALFASGDYSFAALAIRQGLQRDPAWGDRGVDVRYFYSRLENFEAQLRDLQQVALQYPQSVDAQFLLAYMRLLSGDTARARLHLQNTLNIDPADREAAALLERSGSDGAK